MAARDGIVTDRHYVAEVDADGRILGDTTALDGIGWGEEDDWVALPSAH